MCGRFEAGAVFDQTLCVVAICYYSLLVRIRVVLLALPGDIEPCILTSSRPCAVCVKRFLHRDGISWLISTARNRIKADLGLAVIPYSPVLMVSHVRSIKNGWASGSMTGRSAGASTRSLCAMNDLTVLPLSGR